MRRGGGDAKKPVSVRLDPEVYALLEEAAAAEDVPATTLATRFIEQALRGEAHVEPADEKLDAVLDALERIERELPARVASALGGQPSKPGKPSAARSRSDATSLQDYLKGRLDPSPDEGTT